MPACGVSPIRAGVSTPEPVLARFRYRLAAAGVNIGNPAQLTPKHILSEAPLCVEGPGEGLTGRLP